MASPPIKLRFWSVASRTS